MPHGHMTTLDHPTRADAFTLCDTAGITIGDDAETTVSDIAKITQSDFTGITFSDNLVGLDGDCG